MKNYTLIALLIIAASLVTIDKLPKRRSGDAQTVSPEFVVKGIPEHGLALIGPSNPEFDNLITSRHKDADPIVETLKPFAVLIKNTSNHAVIAYALKWELTRADGKIATQIETHITLWKLMGMEGSEDDGDIIGANSFAFATASRLSFSRPEAIKGNDPELAAIANNAKMELMNYKEISVTIDGAFFDDGTYVGSDSTGFFSKVETLVNAKRDLYVDLSEALKHGNPPSLVLNRLDEVAKAPITQSSPSDRDELYRKYKKDAAAELLKMRMSSGDNTVIEFVSTILNKKGLQLRKL